MDEKPDVTVFIPVYNREQYLPETLDSLLGQTFRNFELIVADDGSSDGTLSVAREYAARDPRIRVLSLRHSGEVPTRNAAVSAAHPESRYLMNHDSDDTSMPEKLEKLVAHLDSHPEVGIVGCQAEYFDDLGNHLGSPPQEVEPGRIRATFGESNSMVNSAALIRREVFERIGKYRDEFAGVDDYDFFSRALQAGFALANVPEVLHRIRLHRASISATRVRRTKLLVEQIRSDYNYVHRREHANRFRRVRLWLARYIRKRMAHFRYESEGILTIVVRAAGRQS